MSSSGWFAAPSSFRTSHAGHGAKFACGLSATPPVQPDLEPAPMFRFTIRDVLWLTVVAGLSLALWNERSASRSERAEKESAIFWSKTLQRSIENNGFTTGDGD